MEFINLRNYSENTFLTGIPSAVDYPNIASKRWLSAVALTDKNKTHGIINFYEAAESKKIIPMMWVNILNETKAENILIFPKNNAWYLGFLQIVSKVNTTSNPSIFDADKKYIPDNFFIFAKETVQEKWVEFLDEYFGVENVYYEIQSLYDTEYFEYIKWKVWINRLVISNPTYFPEKDDLQLKNVVKAIKDKLTDMNLITDDFSECYFKTNDELKESLRFTVSDEDLDIMLSNNIAISKSIHIELQFWVTLIPEFEIEGEDLETYLKYKDRSKVSLSSDEWYLRYMCYSNFEYRYDYHFEFDEIIEMVWKDALPDFDKPFIEIKEEEIAANACFWYSKKKQEILDKMPENIRSIADRLEYELYIILNCGYTAYTLIVADFINYAKKNWVTVWPWRGSAAGSIVSYLTKTTDVDPVKYNLMFFRYLNPWRISAPDIDTDFSDIWRKMVIEYCANKYGHDHVMPVCTFGTMAARSVLKDVGRVLWVPSQEMNRLAQLISSKPWTKLVNEYEWDNPTFRSTIDSSDIYKQIYEYACKLEWKKRQLGVHACATMITPRPLTEYTSIQLPPNEKMKTDDNDDDDDDEDGSTNEAVVITQLEAHDLEALGLLKMDFLGLKNMTIIQNTLKLVKERKGVDIDLSKLPLDDQKVYDNVFSLGETTGVFQFESFGMRKYLKQMKADNIEDLIAMVSLFRPWPMDFIPSYIDRKHWREPVKYLNAVLEPVMNTTYGICIYQEQLMSMSRVYSGYTMAMADDLRKWVGKKKKEIIEKHKKLFVDGAVANGHDAEEALDIYEKVIIPAGSYSFNRSHAACYAVIAYWNAFLKTYYPSEYITASLISDYKKQDRVELLVKEFIRLWHKVLPPNLNESEIKVSLEKEGVIRIWLGSIKGIGLAPATEIVEERNRNGKFLDISNFLLRWKDIVWKKVLDGLVSSGWLDSLIDQNIALANMQTMIDFAKWKLKKKRTKKTEQTSVFDICKSEEEVLTDEWSPYPEFLPLYNSVKKVTWYEKAIRQEAVCGFFISTHPLSWLSKYVLDNEKNRDVIFTKVNNKFLSRDDKNVTIFGYVKDFKISRSAAWRDVLSINVVWLDYECKLMCYTTKTEEYRYIIKDSIGKYIEATGAFSVSLYWRNMSVDNLRIIEPMLHIERSRVTWVYTEDELVNIEKVYLYDFAIIEPYINVFVSIIDGIAKDKLSAYLQDFKDFLLKQENGDFHVILRDIPWNIKDTKFYIKEYKNIISFFKWRKKWARLFVEDREQTIPKDEEN